MVDWQQVRRLAIAFPIGAGAAIGVSVGLVAGHRLEGMFKGFVFFWLALGGSLAVGVAAAVMFAWLLKPGDRGVIADYDDQPGR